ncbi:hypothetical protein AND4_08349 [Vibrio sp. AND4]|nr:hypothetical protein AND4_01458 [Vibrio sp. AND4]EDP60916.1 hypothetical protein AND4_08349 [Vibrio sp. AND4]
MPPLSGNLLGDVLAIGLGISFAGAFLHGFVSGINTH